MDTLTRIFGLDAQLIQDTILTGVAIFILFFVLSYLFFDPVREYLAKRKKKIGDELKEAQESLKNAEAMRDEYDEKLKNAEKESAAILDEARKNATRSSNEIIEEAKADAVTIRRNALLDIDREMAKARDDMKKEMVIVAQAMAKQAVSEQMTPEVSDALIDETLKQIGDETWQNQ